METSLDTEIGKILSAEKYSCSPPRKIEMGVAIAGLLLKVHNLYCKIAIAGKAMQKPEPGSAFDLYINNAGNFSYGAVITPLVDATLDAYKHRISENLEDTLGKDNVILRAFNYWTSNTHRQNLFASGTTFLGLTAIELAGIYNYPDHSDVPAIGAGVGLYTLVRAGVIELFEKVRTYQRIKYEAAALITQEEAAQPRKGPAQSRKSKRRKKS